MMGPPLAGSPRVQGHRDYVIKTLLHGMTGPLAGQTFTQVMLPMGAQNDQWIANIASYIRNSFGNSASFITPADVARVRAATAAARRCGRSPSSKARCRGCCPSDPAWKATASHNAERAGSGLTLAAWTTGAPQEPGMWFQVELPQPAQVAEIQFDSGAPGGRGVGRRPVADSGGQRAAPGRPRRRAPAAGTAPVADRAGAGSPGGARRPVPVFGSFPIGYRVQVSMDGKTWGRRWPRGKAGGDHDRHLPAGPAKFIRVTQTDTAEDALPWSVLNFRVYVAGQ